MIACPAPGRMALLLAAAFALALPAAAQAVPEAPPEGVPAPDPALPDAPPVEAAKPQAPPAGPACEIHIFPAERFSSFTTGWLGGGLIEGAIYADRDKDNRTQMAASLDPVIQAEALAALDLAGLLGLAPARIVAHEAPLDRKTINKVRTRRADSASPCYAELIVADMLFQQNVLLGRTLQTLFMVRDFGPRADAPRIAKSWGGNPLKRFPPKEGEDVEAAAQELVDTFTRNFEEFAANAKRSLARAAR
jgi:hypothetical protein